MVTETVIITGLLTSGNEFYISQTFTYGDIALVLALASLLGLIGLVFLYEVMDDAGNP